MKFLENETYHVFNRGNNKQNIFFSDENYNYFLTKIKRYIKPHCDILAYCLMPNHFHLLISTHGKEETALLTSGLRITLSSYSQGVNKSRKTTGSLFQQNTKKKMVTLYDNGKYLKTLFDYIHMNPVNAKLTSEPEEWAYSSYREYLHYLNSKENFSNALLSQITLNHLQTLLIDFETIIN